MPGPLSSPSYHGLAAWQSYLWLLDEPHYLYTATGGLFHKSVKDFRRAGVGFEGAMSEFIQYHGRAH